MSISDKIVVMKLGEMQQMGAPQDVYNSPANLFVAQFLGTPPINVFAGEVKDEKIYVGGSRDCRYFFNGSILDGGLTIIWSLAA